MSLNNNDVIKYFKSITNELNENKKYIFLYLLLLIIFSVSSLKIDDYLHPKFEILIFAVLLLIGTFSIIYYSKNKKNIHKVAFVIIMLFGILTVFLTPINDVCDGMEHLTRAEIVSEGKLTTDYIVIPGTNTSAYETIGSISSFNNHAGENVFNTDVDDQKINYTTDYFNSAFGQNPFYGYLAQGIGIFIAKSLDLNAIWMLWLGRFCNLLLYGTVCAIAIKKTPTLKVPMLVVSCLPLAIFQAASMSVDATINGFAILTIAYFLYMYKSADRSIDLKTVSIFYIACLICGLIKPTYLALSLLIFVVPNKNFKNQKQCIISKLGVLIVLLIGIIWQFGYAMGQTDKSWRGEYSLANNVSVSGQFAYIKNNPTDFLIKYLPIGLTIPQMFLNLFYFANTAARQYSSNFLGILYMIFFCVFSVIYPNKEWIEVKDRIKAFLISGLIYVSTFLILYLTYIPVGSSNITNGVFGRYFIPLLIFIPFIFGINNTEKIDKKQFINISIVIVLAFIGGMSMLTTAVKY